MTLMTCLDIAGISINYGSNHQRDEHHSCGFTVMVSWITNVKELWMPDMGAVMSNEWVSGNLLKDLVIKMMMVEKNITHTQAKQIVEITTNVGEIVDHNPDIGCQQ
ncbi:hypothetical protein LXL04_007195 [Taraxacum kok-saghyz]